MTDQLVQTAVSNWGPRFTANGVDASDYALITSGVERWDDWCAAWAAGAEVYEQLGAAALEEGRRRSAGEHLAMAATYHHFGKFLFVHDREQERAAHARAVSALNRALPLLDPPGRREEIPFDGAHLVGVLRCPAGPAPHPTVVLIPGLDSTKEEFRLVEQAFLDRGMATFALDGPGQGEAEWELGIRPDWEVPGGAVVAHVASLPEVDAERIGVWGVSLGGYYAARLASGDAPVRATIALAGPYDLGAAWDQLNPLTRLAFEVRSMAGSPDEAAKRAGELTMAGRAGQISNPLLVIMGKRDRLFPWEHGQRLVDEAAGDASLLLLPDGNHGCANVIRHHRPLAADWMARHLEV